MASKKPKKDFKWEKGSVLTEDDYEPVPQVREVGFSRLADGVLADPVQRKEARRKKITPAAPKLKGIFVEESQSGLSDQFTPSQASKLIDKGTHIRGIDRFKK